ncbi:hypothetical protein ELI15_14125 [Rhizobium ruizarguesonis]|uniref:hypothetical protein n=1 Tax=Rhizobium ruizarguesonis TaxID=2081791 RepID=UPI001030D6F7|nr:hypothetical protein [Rhizobium ruizarguesonis]TAW65427.1 hypothetical protein ELI15_14125 [Rhizobium ruizarguesonis]
MKLFRNWSRERVADTIDFLETCLANGVQSSSTQDQGSVQFSSPENGFRILRSLYARLDEWDGKKAEVNGPRMIAQRISGGTF